MKKTIITAFASFAVSSILLLGIGAVRCHEQSRAPSWELRSDHLSECLDVHKREGQIRNGELRKGHAGFHHHHNDASEGSAHTNNAFDPNNDRQLLKPGVLFQRSRGNLQHRP